MKKIVLLVLVFLSQIITAQTSKGFEQTKVVIVPVRNIHKTIFENMTTITFITKDVAVEVPVRIAEDLKFLEKVIKGEGSLVCDTLTKSSTWDFSIKEYRVFAVYDTEQGEIKLKNKKLIGKLTIFNNLRLFMPFLILFIAFFAFGTVTTYTIGISKGVGITSIMVFISLLLLWSTRMFSHFPISICMSAVVVGAVVGIVLAIRLRFFDLGKWRAYRNHRYRLRFDRKKNTYNVNIYDGTGWFLLSAETIGTAIKEVEKLFDKRACKG